MSHADAKVGAGILVRTLEKGHGPEPCQGDSVLVHYQGYLEDNRTTPLCSSNPQTPLQITRGQDYVMEGWQVLLPYLELGQKVEVTILPHINAYREQGYPPKVPPKATIAFHMHIVLIDQLQKQNTNQL
jgi:FKBP-type peptidyl-prolyl cis-trans isomerase